MRSNERHYTYRCRDINARRISGASSTFWSTHATQSRHLVCWTLLNNAEEQWRYSRAPSHLRPTCKCNKVNFERVPFYCHTHTHPHAPPGKCLASMKMSIPHLSFHFSCTHARTLIRWWHIHIKGKYNHSCLLVLRVSNGELYHVHADSFSPPWVFGFTFLFFSLFGNQPLCRCTHSPACRAVVDAKHKPRVAAAR